MLLSVVLVTSVALLLAGLVVLDWKVGRGEERRAKVEAPEEALHEGVEGCGASDSEALHASSGAGLPTE